MKLSNVLLLLNIYINFYLIGRNCVSQLVNKFADKRGILKTQR